MQCQLDEKFLNGVLDALDLRFELRSLTDAHRAGNHGTRHSTCTAKGWKRRETSYYKFTKGFTNFTRDKLIDRNKPIR